MENNSFEYTYSAQQHREVEEIRKKYLPKEEDKMTELRRLHAIPTRKATGASIAIGVTGALILGTGMSLCMTNLGAALENFALMLGIPVGLAGIGLIAAAYPLYNRTLKREREKIAPRILSLSEELMK